MRKHWRLIICSLILFAIILFVYLPITRTFYQQDEWYGFGKYLSNGLNSIFLSTNGIISIILGEGRILTKFLYYTFYRFSPLNVVPVAIFSIVLHIINSILVFLLAFKIFKKTIPAFLGSLFFAVNSVSQSTITWPAASINALPSTLLILVAIIFFFNYIELNKVKWLIFSFFLIYISLFFRETGIFLFLLLPLFSLFYKKYSFTEFFKKYWYFFMALGMIVIFRLYEFKSTEHQVALFLTGSSKHFFDAIIVRSILYPITSFSLSIVPPDIFLNFARYITNVYYPFIPEAQFILIAQTIVLDFMALFFTGIILLISFLMYKKSDKNIQKQIVFWFIFLFTSFLPYIIISKSYSYLESRYYYVSSIAWSMIFAWGLYLFQQKIRIKPICYLVSMLYLLFIFVHVNVIKTDLNKLINDSQIRIGIISQLNTLKPTLQQNKNIFLITGDSDYYLIGNKIPFQSGMGYNLMSLYYNSGKIPKEFINEAFLFEIGSQGYKEMGDYGFGYFSDSKSLKEIIKNNKLSEEIVIALYYDSKENKINRVSFK